MLCWGGTLRERCLAAAAAFREALVSCEAAVSREVLVLRSALACSALCLLRLVNGQGLRYRDTSRWEAVLVRFVLVGARRLA